MNRTDTLPMLTIVPAGAGSGKTWYIQTKLAEWVINGQLASDKIVAVTFTESAAAELRNRIRAELIAKEKLDEAIGLDQAYISTIHSFGLRLITEFAFDAGLSPSPRMLNDDEEAILASRALATSESAIDKMQNLERDGFKYDFNSKTGAETSFRKRLLTLTGLLRSIGKDSGAEKLSVHAEKKIAELYGPTEDASRLKETLLAAVHALLENFPADISKSGTIPDSVRKQLWRDYRDLTQAATSEPLDTEWGLWQKLRKLKAYAPGSKKLPAGYDDMVRSIMAAADALPLHPGPMLDAQNHARSMFSAIAESLTAYADEKRSRGLVDYTDMLTEAHKLLSTKKDALAALNERVECLVVDEFQDTNPLQFSLLWSLKKAVPTIVVGDMKQAIMGFQNADARLLNELCKQNPSATDPRKENYRSSIALMRWINSVGREMFDGYTELAPKAQFTSSIADALEVLDARVKLSKEACASHTVKRVVELLHGEQKQTIWDKDQKAYRSLRGGDIALICYTNKRLLFYADALRKAGLRCRLEEEDWFESRIIQYAWYALSYVADPEDLHAALYLYVTETGRHTLQSGLAELIEGHKLQDALLEALDEVAAGPPDRTVDAVLQDIVVKLDLYGAIAEWEDGVQARANLLRLQAECQEFMLGNRDAMACGGYYGSDSKTFLAWLKGKVERDKDGNKQPEASVIDDDAVQLMTWHKSKGREWPVVAVCGLDEGEFPRLEATRVDYRDFSDLDNILEHATAEIYPKFKASETNDKFKAALIPESRESSKRVLYVALTRAREKLILEWPAYLEEKEDSGTYWAELKTSAKIMLEGASMVVGTTPWPCRISSILAKEAIDIAVKETNSTLPVYGRRAILCKELPSALTPESITPSSLHDVACTVPAGRKEESYGGELVLDFAGINDPMEKGKIVHRAFEILAGHPERAGMLPDAVERALAPEQVASIAAAVASFDAWLRMTYKPQALQTELPLLTLDSNGTVISGFADMIVETADGLWVIDHKSDQVPTDALREERFNIYYPQLKCYADALTNARRDKPVRGIVLNWVSYGMVSVMEMP